VGTVVFMASSQVGKTEIALNIVGYHIDVDPCPIMVLEPTLDLADAISKDRLGPMLRDTPALHGKVREERAKDASNTTRHKSFTGGHLTLAGANSPTSLASRPIRILLADEVDRYPAQVGEEGDPLALGIKRTDTFWNRRVYVVSTPTVKGASRIEAWYEESDQRRFFVPCPRCGAMHELEWQNVRWENHDPATAHLVCPACAGRIEDRERAAMVRAGEWRATAPFRGIAGFFVWEAYSPWRRLSQIVGEFLKARREGVESLRAWVNTSLGQVWEDAGERVESHVLLARREPYGPTVPAGVCCLTMGVDVQDDRLELQVLGWGPGEEAWPVEVRTIPGDPQRPEPWAELDEVLGQPFPHASGARLVILATAIDSGGHRTNYVYSYVATRQHLRVYATIGRDGADRPAVSSPAPKRTGRDPRPVPLYTIGVDGVKGLVYSRLRVPAAGPGYVHLPADRPGFDDEYAAQLTAEKLVTKYKYGVASRHWVQTRPRNEALDTFVLALAALRLLNPKLELLAERVRAATEVKPSDAPPQPAASPRAPARRFARSSWMSR
jgi:phage terminase large subunit GpA-like protein